MNLSLQNLKKPTSNRKKKRSGRGNASGKGNYSGRGMKGQRARSGGKKGLQRKGLKTFLKNVPKRPGFKSPKPPLASVNINEISQKFKDGDIVDAKALVRVGLIKTYKQGVKILGHGEIKKKLEIYADSFSQSAKDAIIKSGGKAEVKEKNTNAKVDEKKPNKKERK